MKNFFKRFNNKKSVKIRLISAIELASGVYKIAPFTSIILLDKKGN